MIRYPITYHTVQYTISLEPNYICIHNLSTNIVLSYIHYRNDKDARLIYDAPNDAYPILPIVPDNICNTLEAIREYATLPDVFGDETSLYPLLLSTDDYQQYERIVMCIEWMQS